MIYEFIDKIKELFHSQHPFILLIDDIKNMIISTWNFPVYVTPDKQTILLNNIVIGIILFILGVKFAKRLSKNLRESLLRNTDKDTAVNIERISYYLFLIIITIFVLDITKVPITALTVIGTTFAVGIGLGSQHTANNFISGLIIMIEKPIKIGDIIEVDNIVGRVINIGARCLSIRTSDNINMLIPNSNILQNIVINWTHEDTMLKLTLDFIINREANIDEFEKIMLKVLHESKLTLKNPVPQVLLKGYCKEGQTLEVEFWLDLLLNDRSEYIIDQINRKLKAALADTNIEIIQEELKRREKITHSASA